MNRYDEAANLRPARPAQPLPSPGRQAHGTVGGVEAVEPRVSAAERFIKRQGRSFFSKPCATTHYFNASFTRAPIRPT